MNLVQNPNQSKIAELIAQSEMQAVKWLKDLETGDMYYWPADWVQHASVANELKLKHWEKGIEVRYHPMDEGLVLNNKGEGTGPEKAEYRIKNKSLKSD